MKLTSTVFLASTSHGFLIEVAHDDLNSRLAELKEHNKIPLTVEMQQDLHPIYALKAVEVARKRLEKHRSQGDFFKATREEAIDALNHGISTAIQGQTYYPEDDPGDLFVRKFLGPGYVANLEKWLRS